MWTAFVLIKHFHKVGATPKFLKGVSAASCAYLCELALFYGCMVENGLPAMNNEVEAQKLVSGTRGREFRSHRPDHFPPQLSSATLFPLRGLLP